MTEIIKQFIGANCIVTTKGGNSTYGLLKDVRDGALLLEQGGKTIAVNAESVEIIQENTRSKNSKSVLEKLFIE